MTKPCACVLNEGDFCYPPTRAGRDFLLAECRRLGLPDVGPMGLPDDACALEFPGLAWDKGMLHGFRPAHWPGWSAVGHRRDWNELPLPEFLARMWAMASPWPRT